jgi:hypothetical protein
MTDAVKLLELDQAAINQLDPEFLAGNASADVAQYCQPFGGDRDIDLTSAGMLVEEVMERFSSKKRAESDRWLGPRMHAALRLSRREAARKGVWRFLGVCAFPKYVRWRFAGDIDAPDAPAKLERFAGSDSKHALARLWWMAEIFRNGPDYDPASEALSNQDIINNLFRLDIAHHRPTALGAVRVLSEGGDGKHRTGREANALSKAINATAATVLIDSYAPDEPLDDAARESWIAGAGDYDAGAYLEELPDGPGDPPAPSESVERMKELLAELLAEAPVRGKDAETDEQEASVRVLA